MLFRPPDRYPPRLGALTREQEDVLRDLLEVIAFGALDPEQPPVHQQAHPHLRDEAQQALEEWWLPNPRSRPTPAQVAALRAAPITWRTVHGPGYRLTVPDSLASSGPRDIPEESRQVQTWSGYLCHDAPAVVAVNVTPRGGRTLSDAMRERAMLFREVPAPRHVAVPGADEAQRIDGWTPGDSPDEPQCLSLIIAAAGDRLVLLTVRTWPRADLDRERDRIASSLALGTSSAES